MMSRNLVRIPAIACPHCHGRAIARTSEALTDLVRELRYQCQNAECDHSFVVSMAIIRTVRPSLRPNPNVYLPMSPQRPTPRPANDDVPPLETAPEKRMHATG